MTTTRPEMREPWIGRSIRRREDKGPLTGTGVYVDDVSLPGMLHAAVLRSPFAHASIGAVDTTAAAAIPGVEAVLSGHEARGFVNAAAAFCNEPVDQNAIAVDRTRFAGEAVAVVAASSRQIAEDACEAIDVDFEPLPALANAAAAMAPDAPRLHEGLADNIAFQRKFVFGDVEGDFGAAAHVVRERFRWHRMSPQPLETCGAVASYDAATGEMSVWSNTNMYNFIPWVFAEMLDVPTNKLRMIPCLAGGSFGSKHLLSKVILIAGALSKATGRPVKYVEDRLENLAANDNLGPDREYDAELAMNAEGEFTSLRLKIVDDYGAYFRFAHGQHGNALSQPVGPYRIGSLEYDLTAVLTNKDQQGFFRGAGSDPGNFVIERLADKAARELGIDRAEIRRRNFIAPDEFPYKIPTGNVYDSGDYETVLDKALAAVDIEHWKAEQSRLRERGRYIGIGITSCQERTTYSATEWWFLYDKPGFPLTSTPETVKLYVDATGGFTVTIGSPAWGNSPETLVAMVVAEEFGVDPETVMIERADSRSGLVSTGPGGSRLTVMISGATAGACRVIKEKVLRIAAHTMETDPEALEVVDGKIRRKDGTPGELTLAEVAMKAHLFQLDLPEGESGGLSTTFTYQHPYTTKPSEDRSDLGVFYPIVSHACHIPIVEVDIETGLVTILKYVAVHDSGTIMHPPSLEGQIIGGIAQGIGAAFLEEVRYDDDAQLQSATYGEYLLPSINEVPDIEVSHHETPSPFTEYGAKGAGEGGRMVAPPALASAVEDALAPFGVTIREVPMTPERVRAWIRESQESRA